LKKSSAWGWLVLVLTLTSVLLVVWYQGRSPLPSVEPAPRGVRGPSQESGSLGGVAVDTLDRAEQRDTRVEVSSGMGAGEPGAPRGLACFDAYSGQEIVNWATVQFGGDGGDVDWCWVAAGGYAPGLWRKGDAMAVQLIPLGYLEVSVPPGYVSESRVRVAVAPFADVETAPPTALSGLYGVVERFSARAEVLPTPEAVSGLSENRPVVFEYDLGTPAEPWCGLALSGEVVSGEGALRLPVPSRIQTALLVQPGGHGLIAPTRPLLSEGDSPSSVVVSGLGSQFDGAAVVVEPGAVRQVELVFVGDSVVTGSFVHGGEPVQADFSFSRIHRYQGAGGVEVSTIEAQGTSEPSGRFEVRGLFPGDHTLLGLCQVVPQHWLVYTSEVQIPGLNGDQRVDLGELEPNAGSVEISLVVVPEDSATEQRLAFADQRMEVSVNLEYGDGASVPAAFPLELGVLAGTLLTGVEGARGGIAVDYSAVSWGEGVEVAGPTWIPIAPGVETGLIELTVKASLSSRIELTVERDVGSGLYVAGGQVLVVGPSGALRGESLVLEGRRHSASLELPGDAIGIVASLRLSSGETTLHLLSVEEIQEFGGVISLGRDVGVVARRAVVRYSLEEGWIGGSVSFEVEHGEVWLPVLIEPVLGATAGECTVDVPEGARMRARVLRPGSGEAKHVLSRPFTPLSDGHVMDVEWLP